MTERIRLTITVTPEVHDVFSRMAEASGLSLGRCMGDWLEDTCEGAQFVAQKMLEAKKAPRLVMREMQSAARGLLDEVNAAAADQRSRQALAVARHPAQPAPPSSNTGGKSPGKGAHRRGSRS
jgi:hypothetical protein